MVLPDGTGMKGARVDGATASVSGEKFRKGGVEIIGNEGGNDVFIAVGDDEEVTRTNSVKVVLPAGTREDTWLGACGARSASLHVSVHHFSL